MTKLSGKEGKHYHKKEDRDKDFYSVRALVTEITGIPETDHRFEPAYKEIQRIIAVFQSQEGVSEGKLKIPKNLKDAYVLATRAFYHDSKFRYLLSKIRRNESLSIEEHDILIQHFVECMAITMSDEEKSKLHQYVEEMKEDEYFDKVKRITDAVMKDMDLVFDIRHYPTKLQYLDEYSEILRTALSEWRKTINMHLYCQEIHDKVIENNPKLLSSEPLSWENGTYAAKFMEEMLQLDAAAIAEQIRKDKS